MFGLILSRAMDQVESLEGIREERLADCQGASFSVTGVYHSSISGWRDEIDYKICRIGSVKGGTLRTDKELLFSIEENYILCLDTERSDMKALNC